MLKLCSAPLEGLRGYHVGTMISTLLKNCVESFAKPVPGYSVAVFRIVMGALLLFESVNYGLFHCLDCIYRDPEMVFTYQYFDWVKVPPGRGLELLLFVMGVASLGVMLGFWFRVSIVVLTVCFAWFFLLDAALYLNHFYLTLLFLGILCFIPANRVWALDAKHYAATSPHIRNWSRLWLIIQLEIVLIYAGVVKLNPDWLQLEPLRFWMTAHSGNTSGLTQWLTQDAGIALAAYGVIALHIIGAPLLLWSKTRLPVFCLYAFFHSINAAVFNIGIFPFMTIAATTLLFAPDWPVTLWARIRGHSSAALSEQGVNEAHGVVSAMGSGSGSTKGTMWSGFYNAKGVLIVSFVCIWLLVQALLPTRPLWHEGPVAWNEAGHYFSWRMKLRDKRGTVKFMVQNTKASTFKVVDPKDYLNRRQAYRVTCRPDLAWQFAQFLQAKNIEEGNGLYTPDDITVYASSKCSLNTRAPQDFFKYVDLTALDRNTPRGEWITDLTTELPKR